MLRCAPARAQERLCVGVPLADAPGRRTASSEQEPESWKGDEATGTMLPWAVLTGKTMPARYCVFYRSLAITHKIKKKSLEIITYLPVSAGPHTAEKALSLGSRTISCPASQVKGGHMRSSVLVHNSLLL